MSEQGRGPGDPTTRNVGIGCMSVVAVFAALFAWGMLTGGDDDAEEARSYDVERVCKEAVEQRLKSPSSAEFNLRVSGGPSTYTVVGTVDAENSFGASLRSNIECVISDNGDTWRIKSVTGLG